MSEWQKILKDDAVATLDKLAEKFGHDVIDVEAARVREFYAHEDDRIILTKRLAGSPREGWGAVA